MFPAMGYGMVMVVIVPTLALLAATVAATPSASRSPTVRLDSGASATFVVSARIVSGSARIGAGLAPPAPRMVPRRTSVSAADGRPVPALVYDFE